MTFCVRKWNEIPQGLLLMKFKYPKDAMYKCPKCVRHFMGGMAVRVYDGRCNVCDAEIDPKVDRTK